MNTADALPNDPIECQRLLLAAFKEATQLKRRVVESEQRLEASTKRATESEQEAAELKRVLEETAVSFEELRQEHTAALEELAQLKRWVYGQRRERIVEDAGQQHLFELSPASDSNQTSLADEEEALEDSSNTRRRRRKKRKLDLDHLPHHRHELDVSDEEKVCSCCEQPKEQMGEDITTVLEYEPSRLEVHEYVRPKFVCRKCKDGVSSPPPPKRPIDRGLAGPGLISHVIVSKFSDHQPLYRMEDIYVRHGVHLARSTLCDWVRSAAELLRPLYELMRLRVMLSAVMWTDDTPVTVLAGGEEGSRKGRFWTYVGDDENPYSVYDFTMSRSRDGPQKFLKDFRGYLQADAYAGYDAIFLGSGEEVVEVACWAHARRKFFDSVTNYPRQSHQVLEWIWQLYDIEDRALPLTAADRCALRCAEANPVLDKLEAYLKELASSVLPKSSLAKAVTYARNQWDALRCYTTDGRLTIDNNTAERTLRHQAVGRKNWLFLGSENAGSRAAILYTIMAGAKRHHIEPWAYVRDVLIRLREDDVELKELLPDRWAAKHPESILTHRIEESRYKANAKRDRRKLRRSLAKACAQ
jgi:transposase